MTLAASQYVDQLADVLAKVEVRSVGGVRLGLDDGARQAVEAILATRLAGRKVMVVGNGGSAAIAAHLQCDLAKAVGVRAMVFHDAPLLTALANDEGYDRALEHAVEQWAEPGDLVVAISSSGRSSNILRSVAAGADRGCRVVTLSGFRADNPLRALGEINFYVPCAQYGLVELAHSVLAHHFCDATMAAVSSQVQRHEETPHAADPQSARHGRRRVRRRCVGA